VKQKPPKFPKLVKREKQVKVRKSLFKEEVKCDTKSPKKIVKDNNLMLFCTDSTKDSPSPKKSLKSPTKSKPKMSLQIEPQELENIIRKQSYFSQKEDKENS